jgi:hypothetical protein
MRGLFIGIGGTGDEILAQLKDKVYASLGEIPDTLQFRLIDTEAEEFRRSRGARLGGEGSEVAITGSEYLQLRDDPPGTFYNMARAVSESHQSHPEMGNWFRAELFIENLVQADFGLVRGAGQHRQFARMGTFLNKERLVTLLRKALQSCQGPDVEVPIWIISSVAGGTGAGLYMDLALLARWVAEDMGVRYRLIGASVLPDVFGNLGIDPARAYAVLRELERFQAPVAPGYTGRTRDGNFRFSVSYGAGMTVYLKGPLFDNLVFYNRRCTTEEERRSYFSEIADGLNLLLDESAGDQLFREWINVEEGYAASFNSFRVFLPARLYHRQFVLEGALQVAAGLLPRGQHGLAVGSVDERREEAARILGEEILALFRDLLMRRPNSPDQAASSMDFERLSKEMTSDYIVNTLLGFANPVGVFGMDIGETRQQYAENLFKNIFADIEGIDKVREDFEDSKTRVKAEVTARRRQYEGDGKDGFSASLAAVRELVEEHIRHRIDDSARRYLTRYRVSEQALGRANRVFIEIKNLLAQVRAHLERLVEKDRLHQERSRGQETDALMAMEQLKKRLFGGKGQLAERQYDYLNAVYGVLRWQQREWLTTFLRELISLADQRLTHWLAGMENWHQAIEQVVTLARDENNDLVQRLERQTRIRSASMGLKNTRDMDGYQETLRDQCMRDLTTGEPDIPLLLEKLTWKPGQQPQDLRLEGWPGQEQGLASRDFAKALDAYLEGRVSRQMEGVDGMANYLEWLRDDKRDKITDLADVLKKVTRDFVDTRPTSITRKSLFLHGDIWDADQHNRSPNAFDALHNELHADANIPQLEHNLLGPDGINLFKDRNVIAMLMVDKRIPYSQIPIIQDQMRPEYLNVRNEANPPWRARTYHLFRCDQEAWDIERVQVQETGDISYPLIPGQYVRLLDEPERIEWFAKALAVGVIREQELTLGGTVWVCGPPGDDDERRWVYLTNPDDPQDRKDLHRALVTFVLDQQDRRPNQRGTLKLAQVRGWVQERLYQEKQTLREAIDQFRLSRADLFALPVEALKEQNAQDSDATPREQDRAQAFIGLILTHYLTQR